MSVTNMSVGVSKKPKNQFKLNHEKKPIRILKKLIGSVQFWFYKPETKKTEPNPNQKNEPNRKTSQTGFCSKKPNKNQSV